MWISCECVVVATQKYIGFKSLFCLVLSLNYLPTVIWHNIGMCKKNCSCILRNVLYFVYNMPFVTKLWAPDHCKPRNLLVKCQRISKSDYFKISFGIHISTNQLRYLVNASWLCLRHILGVAQKTWFFHIFVLCSLNIPRYNWARPSCLLIMY